MSLPRRGDKRSDRRRARGLEPFRHWSSLVAHRLRFVATGPGRHASPSSAKCGLVKDSTGSSRPSATTATSASCSSRAVFLRRTSGPACPNSVAILISSSASSRRRSWWSSPPSRTGCSHSMTDGTRGWRPRPSSLRPCAGCPVVAYDEGWCGRVVRTFGSGVLVPRAQRPGPAFFRALPARSSAAYRELVQGAHRFLASHGDSDVVRQFLDCLGIPLHPS